MACIFDFSKENNDYRQRIAVVFCALFERDFLENFYTVLEELFNGNYSILGLKKAVYKNKMYLMKEQNNVKPIIKKDNENSEVFIKSILKVVALLFLLGEVFIEIQNNIENDSYTIKLEEDLTILSDTIITIESQRSIYLGVLRESRLKLRDFEYIASKLEEIDNIFINECCNIRKVMQLVADAKENENSNLRELCNDIQDTISSILKGRELERKFFGNTNINRGRLQ